MAKVNEQINRKERLRRFFSRGVGKSKKSSIGLKSQIGSQLPYLYTANLTHDNYSSHHLNITGHKNWQQLPDFSKHPQVPFTAGYSSNPGLSFNQSKMLSLANQFPKVPTDVNTYQNFGSLSQQPYAMIHGNSSQQLVYDSPEPRQTYAFRPVANGQPIYQIPVINDIPNNDFGLEVMPREFQANYQSPEPDHNLTPYNQRVVQNITDIPEVAHDLAKDVLDIQEASQKAADLTRGEFEALKWRVGNLNKNYKNDPNAIASLQALQTAWQALESSFNPELASSHYDVIPTQASAPSPESHYTTPRKGNPTAAGYHDIPLPPDVSHEEVDMEIDANDLPSPPSSDTFEKQDVPQTDYVSMDRLKEGMFQALKHEIEAATQSYDGSPPEINKTKAVVQRYHEITSSDSVPQELHEAMTKLSDKVEQVKAQKALEAKNSAQSRPPLVRTKLERQLNISEPKVTTKKPKNN